MTKLRGHRFTLLLGLLAGSGLLLLNGCGGETPPTTVADSGDSASSGGPPPPPVFGNQGDTSARQGQPQAESAARQSGQGSSRQLANDGGSQTSSSSASMRAPVTPGRARGGTSNDFAQDRIEDPAPLQPEPSGPPIEGFAVGNIAPEIFGEDVDGEPFRLSDYRGQVVVVDFWGDW